MPIPPSPAGGNPNQNGQPQSAAIPFPDLEDQFVKELRDKYDRELVPVLRGIVRQFARRKLDTGEDLIESFFSEFVRRWPRYSPEKGSLRSFWCRAFKNFVIRAKNAGPRIHGEFDQLPIEDPYGPHAQEEASRNELRSALMDVLANLTDYEREILVQHFLNGKALVDIADELGKTSSAIRSAKSRAMKKLQDTALILHSTVSGKKEDP